MTHVKLVIGSCHSSALKLVALKWGNHLEIMAAVANVHWFFDWSMCKHNKKIHEWISILMKINTILLTYRTNMAYYAMLSLLSIINLKFWTTLDICSVSKFVMERWSGDKICRKRATGGQSTNWSWNLTMLIAWRHTSFLMFAILIGQNKRAQREKVSYLDIAVPDTPWINLRCYNFLT